MTKNILARLQNNQALANAILTVVVSIMLVAVGAFVTFTFTDTMSGSMTATETDTISLPSTATEHNHTIVNVATDEAVTLPSTPTILVSINAYNNTSKAWRSVGLEAANYSFTAYSTAMTVKAAAMEVNDTYLNITYWAVTDEIISLSTTPETLTSVEIYNGTAYTTLSSSDYALSGTSLTLNKTALWNAGAGNTTESTRISYERKGSSTLDQVDETSSNAFNLLLAAVIITIAVTLIGVVYYGFFRRPGAGGGSGLNM